MHLTAVEGKRNDFVCKGHGRKIHDAAVHDNGTSREREASRRRVVDRAGVALQRAGEILVVGYVDLVGTLLHDAARAAHMAFEDCVVVADHGQTVAFDDERRVVTPVLHEEVRRVGARFERRPVELDFDVLPFASDEDALRLDVRPVHEFRLVPAAGKHRFFVPVFRVGVVALDAEVYAVGNNHGRV